LKWLSVLPIMNWRIRVVYWRGNQAPKSSDDIT
jgi:hypothetical protein